MVTPQMGTNQRRPWLMPSQSGHVLPADIVSLIDVLHVGYRPYTDNKRASYMKQTDAEGKDVGKTVALFYTNTDDDYTLGGIIGMSYAGDLGNASVSFDTNEEGANFFRDHLFVENEKHNWILIPHGMKRYLRILRSTYTLYWMEYGYDVTILPASAGDCIIIVKKGKSEWVLFDYKRHTSREPDDVVGYVDDIMSVTSDPLLIATRLLDFAHAYADDLLHYCGIYPRMTYSATGVHLRKKHFPKDQKNIWTPALMAHWLRGYESPVGGYVYAKPYLGQGFEVDQRRAYSTYLAKPYPWKFVMGHPYKDGVLRPGFYLSTITVESPFPVPLHLYLPERRIFTNRTVPYGEHYAIIASCEFEGLRALGCTIEPHYGWVATHWNTGETFVDEVERVIALAGEKSDITKILKIMVNSVVGKMGSNPFMEEIMLSTEHPGDGWTQCVGEDVEPIEHNWRHSVENLASYMNVGSNAWITSSQRNATWLFLAAQQEIGNHMVSWSVDGGLMTGTPCPDMPTQSSVRGTFILKNSNSDMEIFGNNHNIVNGVTKHAGTAKYTTQETRLVLFNAPHLASTEAPKKVLPKMNNWALLVEGKYERHDLPHEDVPINWAGMTPTEIFHQVCQQYGTKNLKYGNL